MITYETDELKKSNRKNINTVRKRAENSTEVAPSPLIYGRKMNDPTKVKTSKRHRPVRVTPLESPRGNPDVDKDTTGKAKSYLFDLTDV